MPSHVVLGSYTDQQDIKNVGYRPAAERAEIETAGGKLIAC